MGFVENTGGTTNGDYYESYQVYNWVYKDDDDDYGYVDDDY